MIVIGKAGGFFGGRLTFSLASANQNELVSLFQA
jgi:hypothetical protein